MTDIKYFFSPAFSRQISRDICAFFDFDILQCLMNSRWSTNGVLWALNYVEKRLEEITECHQQSKIADKNRSMSMPLPIIEVLCHFYCIL